MKQNEGSSYENGSSTMKLSRNLGNNYNPPTNIFSVSKRNLGAQPVHPALLGSPYFREKMQPRTIQANI
jgi:hypothetical protein